MRRILAYNGQIPFTGDILNTNRNLLKAMGRFAQDVLGSATSVSGLVCSPTAPASLAVSVGAGRIYSMQTTDTTAYSDIGTDTDQILKQGILAAAVTLNCPAPATTGQSINYLIQAQYQDLDSNSQALPYYNAANPSSPLSGPDGLGATQATQRDGVISLIAKAGFAAISGSQVTPAPDAGYVGLWIVTVAHSATTITLASIAQAAGAPFLSTTIASAVTQAFADGRYLQQFSRTTAEITAGVLPANLTFPPQSLSRYGVNTAPGVTDMAAAFQSAIDSASPDSPAVLFGNANVVSKPLLIKTGTQENIQLTGDGRVSSALGATAADIHTAAQGINCIIFNQNNNPHLHLSSFEFSCAAGFTGVCIYCVEGGGTDLSGQALFSTVFRDVWMGMPTTNNGFLKGGVQNCKFDTIEVEGCKNAVYNLTGPGCGDVFFTKHTMVSCFDSFILQNADTNGAFMMTVDGLHAYNHQRGPLFQIQNWIESTIANVTLEVSSSNSGSTGLFNINNCTGLTVPNTKTVQRAGLGLAATACIISGTSQIEFIGGQWQASTGIQLNGAGVMDLAFDGIDVSNCASAAIQFNGAFTGTVRTRNCKFNGSQLSNILDSAGIACAWNSYDDEFLNAGLGGNASTRCLNLSPAAGVVINLYNPRIGNTVGASAAAAVFVQNSGLGTVNIFNPRWEGTPSTAYVSNTGGGALNVFVMAGPGGTVASAAALAIPPNGDVFLVSGSTGITSIGTGAFLGRSIKLLFQGTLTVTDGSNLRMASNLSAVPNTSLSLSFDGTNWIETGRSIN